MSALTDDPMLPGSMGHRKETRDRNRHRLRQALILSAKVAVSAGLMAALIASLDVNLLFEILTGADLFCLGLAVAGMFAIAALQAWRWQSVMLALGDKLNLGRVMRLNFIALFFNQTLPSSIGGDAVRVWMVHRSGLSLARAVHGVVLDRAAAMVGILIMMTLALPALYASPVDTAVCLALAVLVAGMWFVLGALVIWDRVSIFGRIRERLMFLADFTVAIRGAMTAREHMPRILGAGLLAQIAFCFLVFLLAKALGVELSLYHSLLIIPTVLLLSVLPISIAGWGVREGGMVLLLGAVGISSADAMALSILMGLLLVLAGIPGGLIWLTGDARKKVNAEDVRNLSHTVGAPSVSGENK